MESKSNIVIGLLGPTLDQGIKETRWEKWRPTVALCQHEDFLIHRFELLYENKFLKLANVVMDDIRSVSPETEVRRHIIPIEDAWDFEDVFASLHDFSLNYPFDPESENYFIHITTGSHVEQISLFLLTESRYFPAKLIQSSPPRRRDHDIAGKFRIIDLDLSRYDRIATRFEQEQQEGLFFLKSGINTKNLSFNELIEQIEQVAINSKAPVLLLGPTGVGKSLLARRIYELKKNRRQVSGDFVEVNCATIRGDAAMSALFGHVKGAFTGAVRERAGHLWMANNGILFLDEIGELGLDEQTMLLRAIEEKRFLPLGADREVESDFQLICGTNRDLWKLAQEGRFREDLLARINLWTFHLPRLRERREDIEPNLEYELMRFSEMNNVRVTFSKEAKTLFLRFATSPEGKWKANFRDLNASMTRMATLAPGGRITREIVKEEIQRLKVAWQEAGSADNEKLPLLEMILGKERLDKIDLFDQITLAGVVKFCRESKNISEAGRILYAISRERKKNANDADRLRKYLSRFGLDWNSVVNK